MAAPAMAQSSTSDIDQIGTGNIATVTQSGSSAVNDSGIIQDGVGNEATVTQSGSSSIGNTSDISQTGNGNDATVTQIGSGAGGDTNTSTVTQTGNLNDATVSQGDLVLSNTSTIIQTGNENTATVTQGDPPNGVNAGPNTSTVTQIGFSNDALVNQGGVGAVNSSTITQDDDGLGFGNNYAQVDQSGSSTNTSIVGQLGDTNQAFILQNAGAGVVNSSDVSQSGSGNIATVTQN
jgi:hypothetical protein